MGTPLCIVSKELGIVELGKVTGMEINHKAKTELRKGDPSASVKIESASFIAPKTYGRHFTQEDEIYSRITRESIDILKANFKDSMKKEDWQLIIKLKKILNIS